jgi:prepilin-type N-terminal cleavage/methylation domain-containing protein
MTKFENQRGPQDDRRNRPGGPDVARTLRVRNIVDRSLRERRRHAERAYYDERSGLTLVELLVVIVILTMVTAATIPLMAPVTGERKVRESARVLSSLLAQAQSRALATGRPAGVWIQRLETPAPGQPRTDRGNQAIDLFLCESPPPYAGDSTDARARVSVSGATVVVEILNDLPPGYVFKGDRIRFNYRGSVFQISGIGPLVGVRSANADGSLTGENMAIQILPTDVLPPLNVPLPYQIFRQPAKTADEPVTFPVGAMIDLGFSGVGNGMEFAVPVAGAAATAAATGDPQTPVLVMFGPSGNLDSVYFGDRPPTQSAPRFLPHKLINPVYLLVGQRNADNATAAPNYMNQENVWVAVNPQSGLVTTSEVAIGTDDNVSIDWSKSQEVSTLISASRAFARSAQNMGGR